MVRAVQCEGGALNMGGCFVEEKILEAGSRGGEMLSFFEPSTTS